MTSQVPQFWVTGSPTTMKIAEKNGALTDVIAHGKIDFLHLNA